MHPSKRRVNNGFQGIYILHQLSKIVTHPIAPRCDALAALLLLAGMSPPRRRALPEHRIVARSGAFNCHF
jgi:hypothetical protein